MDEYQLREYRSIFSSCSDLSLLCEQVSAPSPASGPAAPRSSRGQTSWRATSAPTPARRTSRAPSATSGSCALTISGILASPFLLHPPLLLPYLTNLSLQLPASPLPRPVLSFLSLFFLVLHLLTLFPTLSAFSCAIFIVVLFSRIFLSCLFTAYWPATFAVLKQSPI